CSSDLDSTLINLLQRGGKPHDIVDVAAEESALIPLFQGQLVRDGAVVGGELIELGDQITLGDQHGGFVVEAKRAHIQVGGAESRQRVGLEADAFLSFFGVGAAGIRVGEHEL